MSRSAQALFLLTALGACQSPAQVPTTPPPQPVAEPAAASAPAATAPATAQPDPALVAQVKDLEFEIRQLELVIEEMKQVGVGSMNAENVRYQPNQTTLAARDVQAALDELWRAVRGLQEGRVDMGAPGEGLFDLENGPLGPRREGEPNEPPPAHGQPG